MRNTDKLKPSTITFGLDDKLIHEIDKNTPKKILTKEEARKEKNLQKRLRKKRQKITFRDIS